MGIATIGPVDNKSTRSLDIPGAFAIFLGSLGVIGGILAWPPFNSITGMPIPSYQLWIVAVILGAAAVGLGVFGRIIRTGTPKTKRLSTLGIILGLTAMVISVGLVIFIAIIFTVSPS